MGGGSWITVSPVRVILANSEHLVAGKDVLVTCILEEAHASPHPPWFMGKLVCET